MVLYLVGKKEDIYMYMYRCTDRHPLVEKTNLKLLSYEQEENRTEMLVRLVHFTS